MPSDGRDKKMEHVSLYEAPPPSFSTKDERMQHVEAVGFFVAQVVLGRDITAHFGICEAVTLNLKLGTTLTVNSAIGVIFDHFTHLHETATGSVQLHSASPYWRLARGTVDVPVLGPLALLQSHLSLSSVDAAGKVQRVLKRVAIIRSSASRNVSFPSQRTVSDIATALIQRDCSRTPDQALSQKSLLSVLAKDSEFTPPYLLQLTISEKCRKICNLSLREATARLSVEQDAMKFLILFAKPYLEEILNPDAALRSDWIIFQGHCRHKIHLLEAQSRMECSRRTILREENDSRTNLLLREDCELTFEVLAERERLVLIAIALAGQRNIFEAELKERTSLFQKREQQQRDIQLLSRMSIDQFVEDASAECDECWLGMLRLFDRSVAAVLTP